MRPSRLVHNLCLVSSRTHRLESLAKARAITSTSIRLRRRRTPTLRHLLPRPHSASAEVLLSHRLTPAFSRAPDQQARPVPCRIRLRALSVDTRCLAKRWKWVVARLKKLWLLLKATTTRSSTPPTTTMRWLARRILSFEHNRAALRYFASESLYIKGLLSCFRMLPYGVVCISDLFLFCFYIFHGSYGVSQLLSQTVYASSMLLGAFRRGVEGSRQGHATNIPIKGV